MQTGFVRKQFTGKKLGGLPNSPPSPIYLLASVGNRIGLGSDHRTIKIAGNEEIASLGKEVDKFLFLFPNRQIATPAFIRQLKYIMGGCAGKFKGSDDLPPEDAPVNPDQDEGETVAQEKEGRKRRPPVAKSEDKVDATSVITEEPDKETEKKESDDAPAKEANKDAPLVTV
ncbi:hypothetical protein OIU78_017395 [Salix suchowensis]|nr:hypothetical protein OIU78_017395 [Salix suchowensis]